MFNLVKYELKGYYKNFIIILGILILANLFLLTRVNNWRNQEIFVFSVMLTFAAMVVVFIWNIGIFSRDLYEDTGFLLFALPQSGYSILGAKLITTIIQVSIVGLVAVVFNFIHASGMSDFNGFLTHLQNNINISFIVFMVLGGLFKYISFLLTIYFSISLSKVATKKKKIGKLGGFAIFIVLFIVEGTVTQLLTFTFPQVFKLNMLTAQGELNLGVGMGISAPSVPVNIAASIFTVVLFIVMYWITSYILENKLDF